MIRSIVQTTFGLLLCCVASLPIHAQDYPSRPIRLVVPFAAGGAIDILARIVGAELGAILEQPVISDNRPGGGTILATDIVSKASPDGHTLLITNIAFAINPSTKNTLPYDTRKDFMPLTMLATQSFAIAAAASFPAQSIKDLISLTKKRPTDVLYGTAGLGSAAHIASELFMSMAGVRMTHVGYKGGGQVIADVMGNQIPLGIVGLPNVVPHIKSGRLRVIAITDDVRSALVPEIPTVSETVLGYKFTNWFVIMAPAGIPSYVARRVEKALLTIIKDQSIQKKLLAAGFEIYAMPAKETLKIINDEISRLEPVIRAAKITATF